MKYIDISWPLQEGRTTRYKNKDTFQVRFSATFAREQRTESHAFMGMHTGTHFDAPLHFIAGGKTIDQFPLATFYGTCLVIDCSAATNGIMVADIEQAPIEQGDRVLLKTRNSELKADEPFHAEFVYLTVEAARYLASQGVILVGIDYLSIERNQEGHPTHRALLEHDILILEGLRLQEVPAGRYTLVSFPLAFKKVEAAPARAVLLSSGLSGY